MRMGWRLAGRALSSPSWRVAALRWCFMRLKTRSTMFRPPRETPTDRDPFFFRRPGRVLVDLHARGVHGGRPDLHPDDPLLLQCREQALHRAVPGPAVEPPADGDPLAVALRQVPPRGSRPAHPQQGVDEPVVVDRHVAPLSRQQVRDPHEPVKRDAIPRRTHTPIITQNLNSINTP